ncbi:haloacid dehalogenase [Actinocatenispora thailandica]|uniref:Haloacid dehalogenase n=1 Tax=Actinocatenispora thailandica TaxID=227318 RepID=A0A7R7DLK9_9ACTN|nr:HAD family hydrolase [Actinocatenispora thailandica]BCJ33736.1 haloacid dehalogenase [Actinocatenispora thailandica]
MGGVGGAVLDLDGVLADTEHLWEESWRACAGDRWDHGYTGAMQGMSAPEWARYLADRIGGDAGAVRARCVGYVVDAIDAGRGPLLPGARELVTALAGRVPLGLASSAARPVIDRILADNGLTDLFAATVSSEEVARGKPAPDVYAAAVRRVGFTGDGLAFEDSGNGIRAAAAAGLRVIAIPNPRYPPAADALALAEHVATDHVDARIHALSLLAEKE